MIVDLFISLALASSPATCLAVDGDRIYARDAAQLIPEYAALPAELLLGYTPAPGGRRILTGASLTAIARSQGLTVGQASDVCFELSSVRLKPDEIRSAMIEELGRGRDHDGKAPQSDIAILAWGPEMAPRGQLFFPRGSLQPPSGPSSHGESMWRGYVLYGANRRFGIWARARISFTVPSVVAVSEIKVGMPIRADQVRLTTTKVSLQSDPLMNRLEDAIGSVSRIPVPAGAALARNQLYRPPDIARGDIVQVQVAAGLAHLTLEARAESAGSAGSMILVRNPTSGKNFWAKVVDKGSVAVVMNAGGMRVQ